jgi:putative transcriptional regulator
LDARRVGGLAARGHRRGLARHLPLPVTEAMKNLVRTLRTQQNLAQGQLAEAMGVSRQTINSIETGRYTPSLPLAMALARYFGVTVEEMFDDQGL